MKTIPLTKGKVAIISDEDFAWASQFKWYASKTHNSFYAARQIDKNGKRKVIHLHRLVAKATEEEVDHINGNSLDNRRENLRLVTHSQNLMNQKKQSRKTSSKFKGVYRDADTGAWVVQIKERGRVRSIHGIENEAIAAAIYDLLALDRFGEFARVNLLETKELIKRWNTRRLVKTIPKRTPVQKECAFCDAPWDEKKNRCKNCGGGICRPFKSKKARKL